MGPAACRRCDLLDWRLNLNENVTIQQVPCLVRQRRVHSLASIQEVLQIEVQGPEVSPVRVNNRLPIEWLGRSIIVINYVPMKVKWFRWEKGIGYEPGRKTAEAWVRRHRQAWGSSCSQKAGGGVFMEKVCAWSMGSGVVVTNGCVPLGLGLGLRLTREQVGIKRIIFFQKVWIGFHQVPRPGPPKAPTWVPVGVAL